MESNNVDVVKKETIELFVISSGNSKVEACFRNNVFDNCKWISNVPMVMSKKDLEFMSALKDEIDNISNKLSYIDDSVTIVVPSNKYGKMFTKLEIENGKERVKVKELGVYLSGKLGTIKVWVVGNKKEIK